MIVAQRPTDEIAARWRADCVARMPPKTATAAAATMGAHDALTSELLAAISERALGLGLRGDGRVLAPLATSTVRPRMQADRTAEAPSMLVALSTGISSGAAVGLSPFAWGVVGGASGASLCMAVVMAIRKMRAAMAKRV